MDSLTTCTQGSPILYSFQSICENTLIFFLKWYYGHYWRQNKLYYEVWQLTKNLFLQSNA